jgi:beta-N-acetylhexosaminidase
VALARDGLLLALRTGGLPRARLVEAVTRVLTLKFRSAGRPQPELDTLNSAEHQAAARAAAAAAITVLRGACAGPLVRGPVTVTAASGRETARVALLKALQQAGVPVQAAGGAVVHLIGYGDTRTDLSSDATVTVAMDTPDLLAAARSPILLATYSSSPSSMQALADVLTGKARAPGHPPYPFPGANPC